MAHYFLFHNITANRVTQENLTSSISDSPSRSYGTALELKIDIIKPSRHTARPAFFRGLFLINHKIVTTLWIYQLPVRKKHRCFLVLYLQPSKQCLLEKPFLTSYHPINNFLIPAKSEKPSINAYYQIRDAVQHGHHSGSCRPLEVLIISGCFYLFSSIFTLSP